MTEQSRRTAEQEYQAEQTRAAEAAKRDQVARETALTPYRAHEATLSIVRRHSVPVIGALEGRGDHALTDEISLASGVTLTMGAHHAYLKHLDVVHVWDTVSGVVPPEVK